MITVILCMQLLQEYLCMNSDTATVECMMVWVMEWVLYMETGISKIESPHNIYVYNARIEGYYQHNGNTVERHSLEKGVRS